MIPSVDKVLRSVGISDAVHRIRFGGIVGKLALLGVAGVVGVTVIGARTDDPQVQLVCAVGALVVIVLIGGGILAFGWRYPWQATLEGTEATSAFGQMMAAKGLPTAPEQPLMAGSISEQTQIEGDIE